MSAPRSLSGERAAARLATIIAGFLALHLVLAVVLPLTEDEAYYRLWAQAPALGYYDHPPIVAWLIAAGESLAGDDRLGIRLGPCLLSSLTTLLVYDLARQLDLDEAASLRAALWFNLTLLSAAGGELAVPDVGAETAWTGCLCALARTRRQPFWWLAAGAAAGLGCLAKYSALFLAPGALLWVLTSQERRKSLAGLWPWLALMTAAGLFTLNLAWNATHHWVTFARQFGRLTPHRFAPGYLIGLLGGQVVLLNPIVAVFALRAVERMRRGLAPQLGLPILTSAPFAVYLIIHGLHDQVEAHWPAPLYPALAVAAASVAPTRDRLARLVAPLTGLALCLSAGVYAAPYLGVPLRVDPAKSIRDYPGFARRLEGLLQKVHGRWIGAASYGLAAQLADQSTVLAPVIQIRERRRWETLAPSHADLAQPGVVVDLTRRLSAGSLQACFGKVQDLGDLARGAPHTAPLIYRAFLVSQPKVDVLRTGCP